MKTKNIFILVVGVYTQLIYAQMTQSEAHMSVPLIASMVQKAYNFEENPYYKQLYDEVVQKERQYNNTHYVFYNAFSNEWRVPQDLYLELYKRLHPLTINIEDFRTFRWIPITHETPKEFIKREMLEHGLVNDIEPRIKIKLLSANLALFGNVGLPGECTFDYYIKARSNATVSDDIYKSILNIFDDPANYKEGETPILYQFIPEVQTLVTNLVTIPLPNGKTPGTLSQIFIPKTIADMVAYVSWRHGIPHEDKLVNWIETHIKTRPSELTVFEKLRPYMAEIEDLFKDKKTGHPLFKKILEGLEEGKYNISTLLDEYKATPELVPGLNNMQARLILSPQYIGNPSANVKIFTYDRLDKEKFAQYNQKLNELADKIVATFLKYNAQRGPQWQPSEPKPAAKPVTVPTAKPVAVPQKPKPAPAIGRGRGRY